MTTIAFDGRTVAADGRCCINDTIYNDDRVKIAKDPRNGCVFGLTGLGGSDDWLHLWMDWWHGGADARNTPWAIAKDPGCGGALLVFSHGGGFPLARRYDFQFPVAVQVNGPCAFGSGIDAAKGAMLAGASATRAVEIAAMIDIHTGGKITTLEL